MPTNPQAIATEVDAELGARIGLLLDADRLKRVERRSRITGSSRRENSAEHSWHVSLFALVLAPFAGEPVAVDRVITMLTIHDLVEIEVGDTMVYERTEATGAAERAAAARIFGRLAGHDARHLADLWDEFERGGSADARFARAIDRLQPLLLNVVDGGGPWDEAGIPLERVRSVNAVIARGAPLLWEFAGRLLDAHAAQPR